MLIPAKNTITAVIEENQEYKFFLAETSIGMQHASGSHKIEMNKYLANPV
jgi:hypothetical protein